MTDAIRDADTMPVDSPHRRPVPWSQIKETLNTDPTLSGTIDLGTPSAGDVSGIAGGLGHIEEQFAASALTEGGAAVGTLDLATTVPVGARLLVSGAQVN